MVEKLAITSFFFGLISIILFFGELFWILFISLSGLDGFVFKLLIYTLPFGSIILGVDSLILEKGNKFYAISGIIMGSIVGSVILRYFLGF